MNLKLLADNRSAIALLLGALVFVGGATSYIVSKHIWAQGQLEALEPRFARLAGLGESGPAIDTAIAQRKAALVRHVYPATQDVARAGSDALQRARETFAKAGLDVLSTQVLPPKEASGFDRIPLVLRLEGELGALQSALIVLPAQTPSLFIEGVNVQTVGMPRADAPQRLSIQANLFALRARK